MAGRHRAAPVQEPVRRGSRRWSHAAPHDRGEPAGFPTLYAQKSADKVGGAAWNNSCGRNGSLSRMWCTLQGARHFVAVFEFSVVNFIH